MILSPLLGPQYPELVRSPPSLRFRVTARIKVEKAGPEDCLYLISVMRLVENAGRLTQMNVPGRNARPSTEIVRMAALSI